MASPGVSDNGSTKGTWISMEVTLDGCTGDRANMEDKHIVFHDGDSYAVIGVFDGHGGVEASEFVRGKLVQIIMMQSEFQSDDDEMILSAIKKGFLETHKAMQCEVGNWPKTNSGFPSTSGTTATIGVFRKGKLYVGHVGDSAIVLGAEKAENPGTWVARRLTKIHKLNDQDELKRVQEAGGKVVTHASGVNLVVWTRRPMFGDPEDVPFFKLSRSLGDFWSYNADRDAYAVSPEPDVFVVKIDLSVHRCLVFVTKGVLDELSVQDVVNTVKKADDDNAGNAACNNAKKNPSTMQVLAALDNCRRRPMRRADNMISVTAVLKPTREENMSLDFLNSAFRQMNVNVGKTAAPSDTDTRIAPLCSGTFSENVAVSYCEANESENNLEEMEME